MNTTKTLPRTDLTVEVEYDYFPGEKEQGPTYSSGGEPAVPAEIDIVDILVGDISVMEALMDEVIDELIEIIMSKKC